MRVYVYTCTRVVYVYVLTCTWQYLYLPSVPDLMTPKRNAKARQRRNQSTRDARWDNPRVPEFSSTVITAEQVIATTLIRGQSAHRAPLALDPVVAGSDDEAALQYHHNIYKMDSAE